MGYASVLVQRIYAAAPFPSASGRPDFAFLHRIHCEASEIVFDREFIKFRHAGNAAPGASLTAARHHGETGVICRVQEVCGDSALFGKSREKDTKKISLIQCFAAV